MNAIVIMAGGVGTRLFPASSIHWPKQFVQWPTSVNTLSESDTMREPESLLQGTYRRLRPLAEPAQVFVVAPPEFVEPIREQLPELPAENVLVEPFRRNSAGACALATARILARLGEKTTVMIVPSDAAVGEDAIYRATLNMAVQVAEERDGIVVVGIRPSRAATGYGYIQPGELIAPGAYNVSAFVEKPDQERAERLLEEGCLWNAGIFVWRAAVARQAFRDFLPGHARLFEPNLSRQDEEVIFESLPSISIDVGVAEHSRNVYCVAGHFAWDDLGTWDAFGRVFPNDASGNVALGEARFVDSQDCVAVAETGQIITLGVSDLVVIRFGDTVLVCPRERAQDVGKLETH